ncbi:baseplate assembly protein [Enterobacteriaceae bacterium 89]|nr:baseplate assembly protein [Enterobacteriaceae bacterium 89]
MSSRYLGMQRDTGLQLNDSAHIRQSVSDILRTPVGSRVMRRDYGSLLSAMIDQPQTPALELQIRVACYMALLQWEPRIQLTSITTERQFSGQMVVNVEGQLRDSGESLSLTLPVS